VQRSQRKIDDISARDSRPVGCVRSPARPSPMQARLGDGVPRVGSLATGLGRRVVGRRRAERICRGDPSPTRRSSPERVEMEQGRDPLWRAPLLSRSSLPSLESRRFGPPGHFLAVDVPPGETAFRNTRPPLVIGAVGPPGSPGFVQPGFRVPPASQTLFGQERVGPI
jgi:hypothetical protein